MTFAQPRSNNLKMDQMIGVYEYLTNNKRMLFLYGPVLGYPERSDVFNASQIADSMVALSYLSNDPIWLIIDSPGGFIDDGLNLYDVMKTINCPVYTVGRSCYSMAAILLSAGEKNHRHVYKHSKTMLHLPSGQFAGDEEQVAITAREMAKTKHILIDLLQENGVKHGREKILKDINREYWMNAEETIKYGIADNIIEKGML